MRAVLEDAILCYLGRGRRRRIDPRILAREAEFWIRREDWESPFSFNNVCGALGLAADSVRNIVLGWRTGDNVNEHAVIEALMPREIEPLVS